MKTSFRCPNCKTNTSRFHIVHHESHLVTLNPSTGETISQFTSNDLDLFNYPYSGPEYSVQCLDCGQIDEEKSYIDGNLLTYKENSTY